MLSVRRYWLLWVALWPCAAAGAPQVTVEQAVAAVRRFEGNEALEAVGQPTVRDGDRYFVRTGRGTTYHVDTRYGQVVGVTYGTRQAAAAKRPCPPAERLGGEELIAAGRAFISSHYPGFLAGEVDVKGPTGDRPWVEFARSPPGSGWPYGDTVWVRLDWRGCVLSAIMSTPVPPEVIRRGARIGKERAIRAAMEGLRVTRTKAVPSAELRYGRPFVDGLVWYVEIRGVHRDGWVVWQRVAVDARTGRTYPQSVFVVSHVVYPDPRPHECVLVLPPGEAVICRFRPRSHQTRLWLPVRCAEMLGLTVQVGAQAARVERPWGAMAHCIRPPVWRLNGDCLLPVDALVDALGADAKVLEADLKNEAVALQIPRHPLMAVIQRGISVGRVLHRGDRR